MWVWQQSLVETSKLSSACESNEWGGYKTRIWVIDEEVIKIKIVDGCIIYAIENRRKLINISSLASVCWNTFLDRGMTQPSYGRQDYIIINNPLHS